LDPRDYLWEHYRKKKKEPQEIKTDLE